MPGRFGSTVMLSRCMMVLGQAAWLILCTRWVLVAGRGDVAPLYSKQSYMVHILRYVRVAVQEALAKAARFIFCARWA